MCADSSTECVSLALGIDGNINLSQALASLSPGTKGGFDFLAAMGGEGPLTHLDPAEEIAAADLERSERRLRRRRRRFCDGVGGDRHADH